MRKLDMDEILFGLVEGQSYEVECHSTFKDIDRAVVFNHYSFLKNVYDEIVLYADYFDSTLYHNGNIWLYIYAEDEARSKSNFNLIIHEA
jgi:hypothetical protein